MDRGAWQATVHRIAELDTTERLTHTHSPSRHLEHAGPEEERDGQGLRTSDWNSKQASPQNSYTGHVSLFKFQIIL